MSSTGSIQPTHRMAVVHVHRRPGAAQHEGPASAGPHGTIRRLTAPPFLRQTAAHGMPPVGAHRYGVAFREVRYA